MKSYFYIFISILIVSATACNDFLDEKPGANLEDEDVFSTVSNGEAAVVGSYQVLLDQNYYGRYFSLISAASARVLQSQGNTNANFFEFNSHQVQPTNPWLSDMWAVMYNGIQRTNKVLAYAPNIPEAADTTVNQFLAEAHFLRGLHYFNLVRTFGNVPLYLEPITDVDSTKTKLANATVDQVYEQILLDLNQAEDMMPEDFYNINRASLWSIKALLAKVHLYMGNYEQAANYAQQVMDGPFTLSSDYASVFVSPGDTETMLEIAFDVRSGYNGIGVSTLPVGDVYGGRGNPLVVYYNVTGDSTKVFPLIDSYEDGDMRKSEIFYEQDGDYYITKYTSATTYDNVSLFRLPEILLIYAEAAARSSQTVSQAAFDAYNQVRTRALVPDNMANYPTVQSFVDAVVSEKRREMILENEEWFDYVRAGKADEIGVTNQDYLIYPIPQEERDFNANLEQNPGY